MKEMIFLRCFVEEVLFAGYFYTQFDLNGQVFKHQFKVHTFFSRLNFSYSYTQINKQNKQTKQIILLSPSSLSHINIFKDNSKEVVFY